MPTLYDRVKSGEFLFLDGGTATELARRGLSHGDDPCWSARAVLDNPDLVRTVHADFIRAGSDIIVTNTFRASPMMLEHCGLGAEWTHINTRAVKLAYEAIEEAQSKRQIHVIGSMSTLLPECADSPAEEERRQYARQAVTLADAGAEAIFVENLHDVEHARLALEGAKEAGIATWAGFSCTLGDKGIPMLYGTDTPLETALRALLPIGLRVVCLVHTVAEDIGPCLDALRQHWSGPIGVAPHACRAPIPNQSVADAYTPEEFRSRARKWISSGVRILGGCCGISPEYIRTARAGIQLLG